MDKRYSDTFGNKQLIISKKAINDDRILILRDVGILRSLNESDSYYKLSTSFDGDIIEAFYSIDAIKSGDFDLLLNRQTTSRADCITVEQVQDQLDDVYLSAIECLRKGEYIGAVNLIGILAKSKEDSHHRDVLEFVFSEPEICRRYLWAVVQRCSINIPLGNVPDSISAFKIESFLSTLNNYDVQQKLIDCLTNELRRPMDVVSGKISSVFLRPSNNHIMGRNMDSKVKILMLAANPKNTTNLRLDEEVREISDRLFRSEFRDRIIINQHWATRVSDISESLLRYNPNIVHFSGHGNQDGELIFEDNSGKSISLSKSSISDLFRILKDDIKCVVLNACYSENQARAIADHIDCVVGMSSEIDDNSAVNFASGFYRAIGFNRSIQTAFDLAKNEIDLEGNKGCTVPIIITKNDADASKIFLLNR
ncbi:MAG: CHAT domain-containing protein [Magnetococcales bacterium]|nr:CHAT domain-containing protein [Magnetococcales bacterium]